MSSPTRSDDASAAKSGWFPSGVARSSSMMGFARSIGHLIIERRGWRRLALEPGVASSRGQAHQRIAAARRRFEPTAELLDGLHPAISVHAQTLQDWRELGWNRPSTHRPKLTAGPVRKRKVSRVRLWDRHRKETPCGHTAR